MIPPIVWQPNDIHVWFGRTTDWTFPEHSSRLSAVLSQSERDRAARFHFDRDREAFVLSHALLRHALSASMPRRPESWQFIESNFGKPRIAPDQGNEPLTFNLSHTPGLVACAVAWNLDIGIDVENVERAVEEDQLAFRSFSQREQDYLHHSPPALKRQRFFEIWTLKEAYIKARGLGLSIPLESFSVLMKEGQPPSVELEVALEENAQNWHFFQWRPVESYVVSLAVDAERRPTPVLHSFLPVAMIGG